MKVAVLIGLLVAVLDEHGDIEAQIQDAPPSGEPVTGYESFFVVPEDYQNEDGTSETICNLRWWPY